MYKVEFHSQRGPVVETGTFLVCAGNIEAAEGMVAGHLNIPPSTARFDVSRVKPSIYSLKHTEFTLTDAIPVLSNGGPVREQVAGAIHEIKASAKVFAHGEAVAIRRFADAVRESASANKSALPKHVNELNIDVEKANERVKPSRIDEQSIYREKRFFSGGAARPR